MSRKLKFFLLTLLGFAPACSTVKTARSTAASQSAEGVTAPSDSLRYMIQLMYGVRPPVAPQEEQSQPDSAVVVRGYGQTPRRIITAYGVRSPKDSLVAGSKDSIDAFKCVMPPAPKMDKK